MSDDKNKNPDLHTFIEPELEARIIAWILGEASAFEKAELERLVAEKPELALFKRRIEAVSGLVGEAVRQEKETLRLAPERRAELLAKISGRKAVAEPTRKEPRKLLAFPSFNLAKLNRYIPAAAACLIVGCIGLALLVPRVGKVRETARRTALEAEARQEMQRRLLEAMEDANHSESPVDAGLTVREGALGDTFSGGRQRELTSEDRAKRKSETSGLGPRSLEKPAAMSFASPSQPPRGDFDIAQSELAFRLPRSLPPPPTETSGQVPVEAYAVGAARAGTRLRTNIQEVGQAESVVTDEFMRDIDAADNQTQGADRIVLSPFEVTGEGDTGYNAATTLAGNRLNTKLRDIGNAVSVYTDQFLADTGAADNSTLLQERVAEADAYFNPPDDMNPQGSWRATLPESARDEPLLQYTTNTEVGGVSGNFADVAEYEESQLFAGHRREDDSDVVLQSPFSMNGPTGGKEDKVAMLEKKEAPEEEVIAFTPYEVTSDFRAESQTAEEPVSTFSLHVSDVSFQLVQAAIENQNNDFEPSTIRQEEFYNAFDYGDPAPMPDEKVSARVEQVAHPLMQGRNLVRVAVQVPAAGRVAGQPLRLTVLLDTSGSMEREDRAASVERAIQALASLLGPNDSVNIVGFARQPRLIVEGLPGSQASRLGEIVANTPSEGGTNIEDALNLSINLANRHFDPAAQNRIVLITDGAANLGNANPEFLSNAIEAARQSGLSFDACGIAVEGQGDAVLEGLTRKGDGRYYVINSPDDADSGFARQLAGAFRPAAKNVKLQVRFNPARVASYRLIGFEEHRLNEEDFRNDAVDAAELAAEEAAVAVYQVQPLPEGDGELGEVYVRFLDTATNEMVERSWTMPYDPQVRPFDQATPAVQLAGTSAIFADNLKAGLMTDGDWLDELAPVVNSLRGHYRNEARVQEFVRMYEEVRRVARN